MPRNNDSITLNQESKMVLMGTVMGDGSMNIHKRYKNARFPHETFCETTRMVYVEN